DPGLPDVVARTGVDRELGAVRGRLVRVGQALARRRVVQLTATPGDQPLLVPAAIAAPQVDQRAVRPAPVEDVQAAAVDGDGAGLPGDTAGLIRPALRLLPVALVDLNLVAVGGVGERVVHAHAGGVQRDRATATVVAGRHG